MKSIAFVLTIILFLVLALPAIAETNETTDLCAGIACPDSTKECHDGFVASCPNTCDPATGSCSSCAPDCTGHDVVVGGPCAGVDCGITETVCPDGTKVSCLNPCDEEVGCYACVPDCTGHEAPVECAEGEVKPYICPDGVTGVPWCGCENGQWICMISPENQCPPPVCGNGICEFGEDETCLEDCAPEPCICSLLYRPVCGVDGSTYPNSCQADCAGIDIACSGECPCAPGPEPPKPIPPPSVCGNGICEYGEYCPIDCCPVDDICPDGVTRPCKLIDAGCVCEPCPLPPECWEEVSPEGFVHVICEQPVAIECPPIPEGWEKKCIEGGGKPVRGIGPPPGNCLFIDCIFGDIPTLPITPIACPHPEDIDRILAKCADMGQEGVIVYEGGCKIVKCVQPERPVCPPIIYGPKEEELKRECFERGLEVIEDFDPMGCPFLRCGEPGRLREIPKEAREKCMEMGGEFIEKRDEFGYIVFHECIMPGEHEIRVEPIKRVPDVTELLGIAFSLESLKIELNELGRKTDDIANYYARIGSPEAERFRRVADMFYSAKSKVDEIKTKLKERVASITISDLMDIKYDVMYIKDVILKDILYLMLSTGDDVMDITRGDVKDCGTDGRCFDMAFRSCKKITFRPEGERGPIVEIRGLEGDKCVLYAILPEDQAPPPGMIPGVYPPYEMTCKIPDYSLGVRDPEQGIFPYCEGSLVEVMKQMSGPPEQISGPGGCTSEQECKEYCSRPGNTEECMRFGQERGFEQTQCSGCLDNGICDPNECPGCPDCPTEEEKGFEMAFRACRPGTYLPPNGGPIVKIHGLEDNVCVIHLIVEEGSPYPLGEVTITPEEWNPPYEMICKVPDYYLGTEPPEERILPYCEGSLLNIIEKAQARVVQGVTDCGMDGGCFNMAFRECRPAIFRPGGSGTGMVAKIKGLEGDRCILTQVVVEGVPCCPEGMTPEEWNPPYEMICKVPNYHLGINPPEERVLPYCEGSLVDIIYAVGPRPVG